MTLKDRNKDLEDLIKNMLCINPDQRISPLEALNHPFLK